MGTLLQLVSIIVLWSGITAPTPPSSLADPPYTPYAEAPQPVKTTGSFSASKSGTCDLAYIGQHESGGSYTAVNGQYTGKYQQSSGSWAKYGDGSAPTAGQASPASQEAAAQRQYAAEGSRPWSVC